MCLQRTVTPHTKSVREPIPTHRTVSRSDTWAVTVLTRCPCARSDTWAVTVLASRPRALARDRDISKRIPDKYTQIVFEKLTFSLTLVMLSLSNWRHLLC